MADSDKTWIELEVVHCRDTGFRASGENEALGWLRFDIRLPQHPRREAPITIIHTPDDDPAPAVSSSSKSAASKKATRKTLSNKLIGTLVVRSRVTSGSESTNTKMGAFQYWQSWTVGDHIEEEGYKIDIDIIPAEFDRIQNWALNGRRPSDYNLHAGHRI